MSLTDSAVKKLLPKEKIYRVTDGRSLYLEVHPSGGKYWRWKYTFGGKEKRLSLGIYPEITLKDAREKCEAMRKLLRQKIDPQEAKKNAIIEKKLDSSELFEVVALEWFETKKSAWVDSHAAKILLRLSKHVFPQIGKKLIKEISARELLQMLRLIESRGNNETAHRVLNICSQIFRFAIATDRAEFNIADNLKGALSPIKKTHMAAILEPQALGAYMVAAQNYHGDIKTKFALQLLPLFFVRPGELRCAQWSEFDFENAQWNIPAERMKMRDAHIVPLSPQAINLLQELKRYTSKSKFVFPSQLTLSRPISDNTFITAMRRMGYTKDELTAHGFRATARTLLDEVLNYRVDIIEHQLAHTVKDANGRAYNRTTHLQERIKMMLHWSDYLFSLAGHG